MLQQVQIRNYKNIARAVVDLQQLTVLVGPNGAGKSNFLDALSFVGDSLLGSLDIAFKERGGIGAVRRRSGGHPTNIGMRLSIQISDSIHAQYAFVIAAKPREGFRVAREQCIVLRQNDGSDRFEVRDGKFVKEVPGLRPKIEPDRLALSVVSAAEEFRPVYDWLTSMRFYSIVPSRLRELQEPDSGDFLQREGRNAAAVLKRLHDAQSADGDGYGRICRILSTVIPGVRSVEYRSLGTRETIKFKQDVGQKHAWAFDAANMSDGTLRVLGLLLALYQSAELSLIGIEEPESTVHPAVSDLLIEVLQDAANRRQILFTTHSPEILDEKLLSGDQIRVVEAIKGNTIISPLTESNREVIRRKLYTPGELLRSDEIEADREAANAKAQQFHLFE